MLNPLTTGAERLLELPVLSRIRRNHGLEHATLHILAQRSPGVPLAGHSTAAGFRLMGELPTEAIQSAVEEALQRMQAGEAKLAVHPNCGTNFVTAGMLSGLAGASAMLGVGKRRWDKLERLPLAAMLATLALVVAHPLGLIIQEKVTTSGTPGALQVVEIIKTQHGRLTIHQVLTEG
jgi:hypothetical protein